MHIISKDPTVKLKRSLFLLNLGYEFDQSEISTPEKIQIENFTLPKGQAWDISIASPSILQTRRKTGLIICSKIKKNTQYINNHNLQTLGKWFQRLFLTSSKNYGSLALIIDTTSWGCFFSIIILSNQISTNNEGLKPIIMRFRWYTQ